MPLHEKTVTLHDRNVHYLESGETNGRPLLLIHGGLGDARSHWEPVMQQLGQHYRVLAPDLPGFGKSAPLDSMQFTALVDWMRDFLEVIGVPQAVVVGNSFGALVARLFASTYPQYAPAVVMMNGGMLVEVSPALRVLARVPGVGTLLFNMVSKAAFSRKSLDGMIHNKAVLTEGFIAQVQAAAPGFVRQMRALAAYPLPDTHNPPVPTLLLWGAEDTLATIKDAERIKGDIPDATLVPVAGCGHMPQLEEPEIFIWQLNQFVEKLTRPAAPILPGVGILRGSP